MCVLSVEEILCHQSRCFSLRGITGRQADGGHQPLRPWPRYQEPENSEQSTELHAEQKPELLKRMCGQKVTGFGLRYVYIYTLYFSLDHMVNVKIFWLLLRKWHQWTIFGCQNKWNCALWVGVQIEVWFGEAVVLLNFDHVLGDKTNMNGAWLKTLYLPDYCRNPVQILYSGQQYKDACKPDLIKNCIINMLFYGLYFHIISF